VAQDGEHVADRDDGLHQQQNAEGAAFAGREQGDDGEAGDHVADALHVQEVGGLPGRVGLEAHAGGHALRVGEVADADVGDETGAGESEDIGDARGLHCCAP
jgi:hypothetical protein